MTGSGLGWLSEWSDDWAFCLTFVRGRTESEVFAAFGAKAQRALPLRLDDTGLRSLLGISEFTPVVQVGRSGDWLFALESWRPHQGTRPKVLSRLSAGGAEAVSLLNEPREGNDELGHAFNGELVTSVVTTFPPAWGGSQPDRLAPLAQEIAQAMDGPLGLSTLLTLAEQVFGLSLEPADLDRPLPTAAILPVLDDLWPPPSADLVLGTGDPTVDRLISRATPDTLSAVLAGRLGRLMAATRLDAHRDLVEAVRTALAEGPRQISDEHSVGLLLRRLSWQSQEAEEYRRGRPPKTPIPEDELRARIERGDAVRPLRHTLAGNQRQALAWDILRQRWRHACDWREQALADLAAPQAPDDRTP